MNRSQQAQRIGLALSGGGGRCFAQIGAIKALEEAGYEVDAIAANSTAAIIGALYAACRDAAEVETIVRSTELASFLQPDGSTGLLGHEGIEALLAQYAPDTFEELEIALAVPAVDIERAELLIFRTGPLRPAVCASNAFPGLFTPVEYRGRQLMDGGIINNFPVDVIRTLSTAPVLGIDVRPAAARPLELDKHTRRSLFGKIVSLFGDGLPTTVDVLIQAYSITQSRLVELTCALHPPNLWLRPELPHDLETQDFGRLDEAFAAGHRCVEEALAAGRLDALARAHDR